MTRSLLAALLLTACGDDPGGGDDAAQAVTPSAYTYTPDGDSDDSFDAEAIEAGLDEVFSVIRDMNARHVVDSYDTLMAEADASCPGADDYDGYSLWINACTSESGAHYQGYAYDVYYPDYDVGGGTVGDYTLVAGTADITSADGHLAHVGGNALLIEGTSPDGGQVWYSVINGSFFSELPGYADTWLATGDAPSLTLQAVRYEEYDINLVSVSGSMALQGAITAVSTDALGIYTYNALYGDHNFYPCAEEPAGSLAFRDDRGAWYEVTFDVDPETLAVDGDCDGCAMVTRDGEPVGEICIDASTLVDWESTPW